MIGYIIDDFKRMRSDFKDFLRPKPIGTAEDFIRRFEAKEEVETKEQALKRLGLDRIPCRLTDNDIKGFSDPEITREKYRKFRAFMEQIEQFERDWQ